MLFFQNLVTALHDRKIYMSLVVRENRSSGFSTRSDTNRTVQPQKMATSLKFRI